MPRKFVVYKDPDPRWDDVRWKDILQKEIDNGADDQSIAIKYNIRPQVVKRMLCKFGLDEPDRFVDIFLFCGNSVQKENVAQRFFDRRRKSENISDDLAHRMSARAKLGNLLRNSKEARKVFKLMKLMDHEKEM